MDIEQIINTVELYPLLGWIFFVLLGLIIGSFLNVVIYRLPVMLYRQYYQEAKQFLSDIADKENFKQTERFDLIWPTSRCANCEQSIRPWQNIPILSYMLLRGRCANCQAKIPLRYPVVECLTAILSLCVVSHFGFFSLQALAALLLTWALIALVFIDYDEQILPDDICLPLLWLGLLASLSHIFVTPNQAIIGAVAGYLSLWSVFWLFKLTTGKEGMGYGDFKLLAALGAWLGWEKLPMIILLSSLMGALIGIGLMVFKGHGRNQPIPFGPYLALAGWVSLIWGDKILVLYR